MLSTHEAATVKIPTNTHEGKIPRTNLIAIAVLILSTFLVILNEMFMGVALPRVMDDFSISASNAQWLTTGYMLAMAVIIPISVSTA